MTLNKYIDTGTKTLNPFAREMAADKGDRGLAIAHVKGVDEAKREVTATLSTGSIDRYGEVVLPSAYEKTIASFMENPKFIAGHRYATMDGSPTSIGHWTELKVTSEGLIGTAKFLPPGDALADKWWFRFLHKAQRTFSVGFITLASEMREASVRGAKKIIRHFTEVELLEVSAVEIPANADALLRTAAFGFGEQIDGVIDQVKSANDDPRIKAIAVELAAEITKSLTQLMTDPVGPVDALVRQVVEQAIAARSFGHDHDHDQQESAPNKGAKEFMAQLRAAFAT